FWSGFDWLPQSSGLPYSSNPCASMNVCRRSHSEISSFGGSRSFPSPAHFRMINTSAGVSSILSGTIGAGSLARFVGKALAEVGAKIREGFFKLLLVELRRLAAVVIAEIPVFPRFVGETLIGGV